MHQFKYNMEDYIKQKDLKEGKFEYYIILGLLK